MTPCEKILWQRLRDHKIGGLKFRRQHPVKRYIADFYCHEARLVIEVDGPLHNYTDHAKHDQQRDGVMEDYGIKVLRFTNTRVRYHIHQVVREIREVALSRKGMVDKKAPADQ